MVGLDIGVNDTYTQKLKVPSGLSVTDATKRGWLVSPMGKLSKLQDFLPIPSAQAIRLFIGLKN